MQKTFDCNGPDLPDYPDKLAVKDVTVYVHDSGMMVKHDYSCPVCRKNHAVLNMNTKLMQPCRSCEKDYTLVKIPTKGIKKFLFGWLLT